MSCAAYQTLTLHAGSGRCHTAPASPVHHTVASSPMHHTVASTCITPTESRTALLGPDADRGLAVVSTRITRTGSSCSWMPCGTKDGQDGP